VTKTVLAIKGVSHRFGADGAGVLALENIDLEVPDSQFVAIVGPSGCGKSTLLSLVAGLRPPSKGTLLCDGERITRPVPRKIGMIFQEANLLPWLTAVDNVAFPLKLRGEPKIERRAAAKDMLALTGLTGFEDKLPHQLSGGMKQRVAIARAFANDPEILLMDEPFAALDEQTRMLLGDELLRIWSETRKTVLFVTHSLNEAVYLADRIIVLSARPGRIVDDVAVDLPRPRTFAMTSSERFGVLKDRIWQHIRRAERV
jgi:NitT/TauT family transport system ATP-binding protein